MSPIFRWFAMRIARTIPEVRAYLRSHRLSERTIGLVPTMGAFHEGHLTLMRRARADEDIVVVSLFVNPIQFNASSDFETYPRDFDRDALLAQEQGVDLVFAPPAEEMYPAGFASSVRISGLTDTLCGAYRPGHFDGVTTVCSKLFCIIQPDRAYFGEKDYQQVQVVRRMVADLSMPIVITGVPTVREADGLAMSSRNQLLTPKQRAAAPGLYRALQAGAEAVRSGADGPTAEATVAQHLAAVQGFEPQYVSAVDPETLQPATWGGPPMVLALAGFFGNVRLIDNVGVEVS